MAKARWHDAAGGTRRRFGDCDPDELAEPDQPVRRTGKTDNLIREEAYRGGIVLEHVPYRISTRPT